MTTRVTVFSTNDMKKNSGTLVLAGLGLGVGLLLIDHAYSAKGHSALDRIFAKIDPKHITGADAGELRKLPPFAQQVVQHAIASESDTTTLTQLADNLQAAGYAQTAAQVRAKVHG